MRRADRLFRVIQILRRRRRPLTAREIAQELETSPRTIYRDIAQLMADRVPIRGEAGVGYVLEDGFDMPPLMLTPDEIEAAMLGAQWVMGRGDVNLARAAGDLVAKIGAVIPEHLHPFLIEPAGASPRCRGILADAIDMGRVRAAIRAQSKIRLDYRDEQGAVTHRVVWPIAIGYFEAVRMVVGWCELRQGFRHFRADRIIAAEFLADHYPTARTRLLVAWKRERRTQTATSSARPSAH